MESRNSIGQAWVSLRSGIGEKVTENQGKGKTRRNDSESHFESLIEKQEFATARKSFKNVRELARLYRVHSARLAQLQTRAGDPEAVRFLNGLCLRAYNLIYSRDPSQRKNAGYLLSDLPAALATTWRLQLLVTCILVASVLAGANLGAGNPRALAALVPASMYPPEALEELAMSREARTDFLAREKSSGIQNTFFGSSLFINNTRVGLLSFATGILGGVPSLLLVTYNGLTLGAFLSMFASDPDSILFWAWIIPHGIPELLAIVLCSTGGLAMGVSILTPGRMGRVAALRAASRNALQLIIASVPLFMTAALIESFVRESTLSTGVRFAVAGCVTLALGGYVIGIRILARRQPKVDVSFLAIR